MATLTVTSLAETGVAAATESPANGGDVFANDGRTFFRIVNSSGANAYTVTAVTSGTTAGGGLAIADTAIAVGTSATVLAGPFTPLNEYNNASGQVSLTYTGSDANTDLTIGVYKLLK
jgi:hypothetical protein